MVWWMKSCSGDDYDRRLTISTGGFYTSTVPSPSKKLPRLVRFKWNFWVVGMIGKDLKKKTRPHATKIEVGLWLSNWVSRHKKNTWHYLRNNVCNLTSRYFFMISVYWCFKYFARRTPLACVKGFYPPSRQPERRNCPVTMHTVKVMIRDS